MRHTQGNRRQGARPHIQEPMRHRPARHGATQPISNLHRQPSQQAPEKQEIADIIQVASVD
jgi:hypothetical protein